MVFHRQEDWQDECLVHHMAIVPARAEVRNAFGELREVVVGAVIANQRLSGGCLDHGAGEPGLEVRLGVEFSARLRLWCGSSLRFVQNYPGGGLAVGKWAHLNAVVALLPQPAGESTGALCEQEFTVGQLIAREWNPRVADGQINRAVVVAGGRCPEHRIDGLPIGRGFR